MNANWLQSLLCCAMLALVGPHSAATAVEEEVIALVPMPSWEMLEYEQRAFLVRARSRIEVSPSPESDESWLMTSRSSVASNSEEVRLEVLAIDGSAEYRSRLSRGREQRFKTYDFEAEHIDRVRFDPGGESSLPPDQWPISSRQEVAYPAGAEGLAVTDGYALLVIAGQLLESGLDSLSVVVNTEFNFYLVNMSVESENQSVDADYRVTNTSSDISGKRTARVVKLAVSPLGEQPDKHDFSLLGLTGDATIFFDKENGLPIQLRGRAPRIGNTQINLKSATLRSPLA
ncbi:MAG: hypothetical protein AAGI44_14725 [Pseudomonadota bacterium]